MGEWEKIGATLVIPVSFTANGWYLRLQKSFKEAYNLGSGDQLEIEVKRVKRVKPGDEKP